MEENYEQLIKKILEFWKLHDGKEFNSTELRKTFNHYELATILTNNNFKETYHNILAKFNSKIYNLDNLFTEKEAEELIKTIQDPPYLFKYLSDDKLLTFLSEYSYEVSKELSSDEARIKGLNLNISKNSYIKTELITHFESDKLKLEYLKKVPFQERTYIFDSLKDESLIEKYITFFSTNKGTLISKLSNNEKKVYYFQKFFRILNNDEKSNIISSLEKEEQILYFLTFCNDKIKADTAIDIYRKKNIELCNKIIQMIKNKKVLAELLKSGFFDSELIVEYIHQIDNMKELFEIVSILEDNYKIKFLEKFNEKQKIELIKEMFDPNFTFRSFKYINKKELLIPLIEHCEIFPEYSDEYEYIIDLYSNKYQLNKEHLLFISKNISFSILKVIENPNIIKILNSTPEEFTKVMQFFNKKQLQMNSSSMNDCLNSLLQREFRIKHPEIILFFPNLLNAINNQDKSFLLEKINILSKDINISIELSKNNWSLEEFVNLLLEKNENAIDCLKTISIKFIRKHRNNYIQENLQPALEQNTINKYDKNDLMKYMITNYPTELILSFFTDIKQKNELKHYTSEEIELLKNNTLIKNIISYKKNPKNFIQIPEEIKSNMKLFNNIFEKAISNHTIDKYPDINIQKKICEFKNVDPEFLINIMMNLDIDKIKNQLFQNSELLDVLMNFWYQYKIGGWGNTFNSILSNIGINVDPEVIANFIQYFGLSYEILQEKIKKEEVKNISITSLLDLATCYSSESQKYSMIFGTENFKYIASNPGPNTATMLKEKRIKNAIEFLKTIRTRNSVTVPPIDQNFSLKNKKNINIVVGNFSNIINLTYGERTGSCMRIGGAGKSLFEFCLNNENGFHIRFSNPDTGKFISRVSGFRNGNTLFLNELRFSEDPNYSNKDIVEACQLISEELIKQSKNSSLPIENIIITPYYSMKESNIREQKLDIPDPQLGMKKFYTDISSTSIVLATSNPNNNLSPFKLGIKGVPKYQVQRDKKRILYNKECQEYVAHLKVLDQILSGNSIEDIDIEIDQNLIVCFAGEDWCVTIDKNGTLNQYVMNNTNNKQQALDEMKNALTYLKENFNKEISISNNISLGM